MVGYPYTKYMVSVMDVDMAAALVLDEPCERPTDLGVPPDRRVYLRGWCYATDPVYVAEQPEMWRSPAMAGRAASARSGGRRHRRRRPPRPVQLLRRSSTSPSARSASHPATTRGHGHRRPPVRRRRGQRLHEPRDRDDGRRPAQRPGRFGLVSGVGMHMTKRRPRVWRPPPGAGEVPHDAPAHPGEGLRGPGGVDPPSWGGDGRHLQGGPRPGQPPRRGAGRL